MATISAPFLLLTLLAAVIDWIAVDAAARRTRPDSAKAAELAKPAELGTLSGSARSTASVDPAELVEPAEAANPAEPAGPDTSVGLAKSANPVESAASAGIAEPAGPDTSAGLIKSAETSEAASPAESATSAGLNEPADAEPGNFAEPAGSAALAESATSALPAKSPKAVEYVAKPLTMVFLIIAALFLAHEHRAAGPHHASTLVVVATVVALGLSLVGDVFLMLPEDSGRGQRFFVVGLGAFLFAHVAYIVAFVRLHHGGSYAISFVFVGVVVAVAAFVGVGLRILGGARAADPVLGGPVLAYLCVISVMAVAAWWTGDFRVILGAMLFVFSDAVIGWTRFVRADRRGPVAIIVSYHLAQLLLVLGLLRH